MILGTARLTTFSAQRTQTDSRTTGHDEESARGHGDVIEIKVEHEFMQR